VKAHPTHHHPDHGDGQAQGRAEHARPTGVLASFGPRGRDLTSATALRILGLTAPSAFDGSHVVRTRRRIRCRAGCENQRNRSVLCVWR
jgi:hypothetical protein